VNAAEREIVIALRVEVEQRVRRCPGCGGAGRLRAAPGVMRRCPLCRAALKVLDESARLLSDAGAASSS
jgi:hypothetical protein